MNERKPESRKAKPNYSLRRKVLGATALAGSIGLGVLGTNYGASTAKLAGNQVISKLQDLTGANAPTQKQLSEDPTKNVNIVAFYGQGNSSPYVATSVEGAVDKVDPNVNAASRFAVVGYIEDENHNSSVVVPGQVLKVPELNK